MISVDKVESLLRLILMRPSEKEALPFKPILTDGCIRAVYHMQGNRNRLLVVVTPKSQKFSSEFLWKTRYKNNIKSGQCMSLTRIEFLNFALLNLPFCFFLYWGIAPEIDTSFAGVNDAVEGKRDLKKLGSTVKETSSVYVGIANQLGNITFNEMQKQWVSHVSDNKKLIQVTLHHLCMLIYYLLCFRVWLKRSI